MSFWARAMVAAKKAVAAPMMAITIMVIGASTNKWLSRATTYNPAVTMVAA